MAIINGYDYSSIRVTPADRNRTVFTINLPLTNLNGGMLETNQIRKIEQELQGLDINAPTMPMVQRILGYTIYFDLSYTDFIKGADLMNIDLLLYSAQQGDALRLTPRIDQPSRWFDVILSNSEILLGLGKGGVQAWRNKAVTLQFRTKNLEQSLKWILVPEPSTVFGVITKYVTWVSG
jgi:hypothetical protein